MTDLLRTYLAQQGDRIQPQNLDYIVFVLERTIEALTHAAGKRTFRPAPGWAT